MTDEERTEQVTMELEAIADATINFKRFDLALEKFKRKMARKGFTIDVGLEFSVELTARQKKFMNDSKFLKACGIREGK